MRKQIPPPLPHSDLVRLPHLWILLKGSQVSVEGQSVKELQETFSAVAHILWIFCPPPEVRQPPPHTPSVLEGCQNMVLWPCMESPEDYAAMGLVSTLKALPLPFN